MSGDEVSRRGSGDPGLRIGDVERADALRSLDEHFAAGRLERAELDERSVAAREARTRGDLDSLFFDLPGSAVEDPVVAATAAETAHHGHAPARREGSGNAMALVFGVLPSLVLVVFLLLGFTIGWDKAWIVWIVWPVVGALLRAWGTGR